MTGRVVTAAANRHLQLVDSGEVERRGDAPGSEAARDRRRPPVDERVEAAGERRRTPRRAG